MSAPPPRPLQRRSRSDSSPPAIFPELEPVLARLYLSRGVTDPAELDYELRRLAPIGALAGIGAAVDLLLRHRRQRIVIVGDFDADGATSTALVMRCLREFGFAEVSYLVPNRFEFGYGLTPELVTVAAQQAPALLITVDNGVSSVAGVSEALQHGIDVLVTDHHLPGAELPRATAMINPNLPGSDLRIRHLAGVGVAFYLMAALGRRLQEEGLADAARIPAKYLDLVALGTVADVVSLDHNNRVLVTQGLRRIRAGRTVAGIRTLLVQAGKSLSGTVSTDLGFAVGPRLNAAGRLEDMSLGIECLLTDDAAEAGRFAAALDEINRERRSIEDGMRRQAFAFVDEMRATTLPACVCVFDPHWHQGVVGLIAARVKERCHRPAIAFARDRDGQLKGSARSIPGVHIRDLLEAVASARPGLIGRFGGHAMAAGLTLSEQDFPQFSSEASAQLVRLYPSADFSGAILTDGPLPGAALNLRFARLLRDAGPWGAGFPEPLFDGDFCVVEQRTVGDKHLKLRVQSLDEESTVDAIAFNQAGPAFRGAVRLAYRLDVNDYRGVESAQLIVEQIASLG